MWGLWWTKRHLGRFSPSTSVSPANYTNFSITIITRGWPNMLLVAAVPSEANSTLRSPSTIPILKKLRKQRIRDWSIWVSRHTFVFRKSQVQIFQETYCSEDFVGFSLNPFIQIPECRIKLCHKCFLPLFSVHFSIIVLLFTLYNLSNWYCP
jgi:hypothetical protein